MKNINKVIPIHPLLIEANARLWATHPVNNGKEPPADKKGFAIDPNPLICKNASISTRLYNVLRPNFQGNTVYEYFTLDSCIENGLTAHSFTQCRNAGPASLKELLLLAQAIGVSIPIV